MPMTHLNDALQETIFLEPVTLEEIKAIVSSLKNNATGFDEINTEYLKMSMAYVANPLVYICNMSLSEGVFPTQLKIANVVPLYKCDNFWKNSQFYMNISLDLEGNDLPFSTYYIDWQIDPVNRKWRICYRCVFRLFKGFWYRKSWNTVGQIISLWHSWLCSQMV